MAIHPLSGRFAATSPPLRRGEETRGRTAWRPSSPPKGERWLAKQDGEGTSLFVRLNSEPVCPVPWLDRARLSGSCVCPSDPGSRSTKRRKQPMPSLPADFPDFGLTPEQRREAVFGHYYEYPGMDGERGEIWCYTDRFSYLPGDTATLFVSSTADAFPARAFPRRGGTGEDVRKAGGFGALAGLSRSMFGRRMRLAGGVRACHRSRLAVRGLSPDADG